MKPNDNGYVDYRVMKEWTTIADKIEITDCTDGLKKMPDNYIQCCVTSPPYYRLRNYGVQGQLGMEQSPELFVERLVAVLEEVKRVLKPDGVLWLNLGDSYWSSGAQISNHHDSSRNVEFDAHRYKKKDLIGIPWMVAFALRKQGWYLRQDIVWHKPNPMMESVTDRCTKSHEYIFLLSKSKKYYFDNDAIKTEAKGKTMRDLISRVSKKGVDDPLVNTVRRGNKGPYFKANRRSVWSIPNRPFKGAHFATFPPEIPELCILAGSREGDIILDPFMGAGTTAMVAKRLNRRYIGFELNPNYVRIAEERLAMDNIAVEKAIREN